MATLPPTLQAFRPVDGMQRDSRLGLGDDGQVRKTGEQSRLNIFSRAWDFMTRSGEQVQANKSIAQEFVRGIRQHYGDQVARMVSRELEGQLKDGRPLTAHRVERTLDKAQQMAGRIEAGNRQVMDRVSLDDLVQGSIYESFDQVNDEILSPQERRDVVQRAIEQDPKFKTQAFQTPIHELMESMGEPDDLRQLDGPFVSHFSKVGGLALERAAYGKLLPNTSGIVGRDGTPGDLKNQMDNWGTKLQGLDEDQKNHFVQTAASVRNVANALISGDSSPEQLLGFIGQLRAQLTESPIADMELQGKALEYRDALLQDMRVLEQALTKQTGLDELEEPQQQALLDAHTLSSDILESLEEGSQRMLDSAPEHLEQLQENLQTLRGANPEGTQVSAQLAKVIADAQTCIAMLNALEQGVTIQDLSRMREAGMDMHKVLSTVGGEGFQRGDIDWLHGQGKPVGETLSKFTAIEARALHMAGKSIEEGLQISEKYRELGLPIHSRTLVGELREENVIGEPKLLSGGMVSKPYEVTYGDRQMVFKEARLGEGYGPQSKLLGIDPGDPRMAVRNVATRAIDELLEFDLVPDTQIGTLGGKLGVVMDFAPGASPQTKVQVDLTDTDMGQYVMEELRNPEEAGNYGDYKIVNDRLIKEQTYGVTEMDFSKPEFRRELVKLQLLDALTAQGDRHAGNYVVELDDEGGFSRLRAIDNDQAFGPKVVNPNELLFTPTGGSQVEVGGKLYGNNTFHGVLLPPVVDRSMKEKIDSITPESLRRELSGLLPEKEVEATILRLGTLKAHLNQLEKDGMVIEPNQWGSERATNALKDPDTSYVGRESTTISTLPPISYEEVRT